MLVFKSGGEFNQLILCVSDPVLWWHIIVCLLFYQILGFIEDFRLFNIIIDKLMVSWTYTDFNAAWLVWPVLINNLYWYGCWNNFICLKPSLLSPPPLSLFCKFLTLPFTLSRQGATWNSYVAWRIIYRGQISSTGQLMQLAVIF